MNVLYTVEELKSQARINLKNLKELGVPISYMQCLHLLAKSYNLNSWEALEKKAPSEPNDIKIVSETEIEINTQSNNSFWIGFENYSLNLISREKEITLSLSKLGEEDNENISFNVLKEDLKSLNTQEHTPLPPQVVLSNEIYYEVKAYIAEEDYKNGNSIYLASDILQVYDAIQEARLQQIKRAYYNVVVVERIVNGEDSGEYVYSTLDHKRRLGL